MLFEDKKQHLLRELRKIALCHNRDYYVSIIPFVEQAGPDESDLIDAYQAAVDADRSLLMQSRKALESVSIVRDILGSDIQK